MTSRLVVVSGPPGTGKTSVSAQLASDADRSVHLESDRFYGFLAAGRIAPHRTDASSQNEVVIDAITQAARVYLSGGYAVVWDGVVGPWYLERVIDALGATSFDYVVLRAPLTVLHERIRNRGSVPAEIGVEAMHPQFDDLGDLERCVVDASASLGTVTTSVRALLESGRARIVC